MTRTNADWSAQKLWDRCGEKLPEIEDDEAMLALVKRAKDGDEVATAGIMLVMEQRVRRRGIIYGKASSGLIYDAEVTEGYVHGQGGALSHLWIAIGTYDVEQHPTRVARRLASDVEYLCRAPSRLANVVDVDLFADREAEVAKRTGAVEVGYGEAEAEAWLEEVLEANDIAEVRRDIARTLYATPMTDRELAAKLGIPFGSMSRHSQGLRRELAGVREELVA